MASVCFLFGKMSDERPCKQARRSYDFEHAQRIVIKKSYTLSPGCGGERVPSTSVTVQEVMDPNFGFYTWPSAKMLASFLWRRPRICADRAVVELGSGTGLVGAVAAKQSQQVLLTDLQQAALLRNIRATCALNGLDNARVRPLVWSEVPASLLAEQCDLILGADVLFDPRLYDSIFCTVRRLGAPLLTVRQRRGLDDCDGDVFDPRAVARKWGLAAVTLPFDTEEDHERLPGEGSLELMVFYFPYGGKVES